MEEEKEVNSFKKGIVMHSLAALYVTIVGSTLVLILNIIN